MASCDLFVRPTNTDGDSVSIREALHLGLPVVASDAVSRPEVCSIFATRDMDDFERAVRHVLDHLDKHKRAIEDFNLPDNAQPILDIYNRFLKGSC
jgi:glycosyltransferase involved in cell wall biosynthesis